MAEHFILFNPQTLVNYPPLKKFAPFSSTLSRHCSNLVFCVYCRAWQDPEVECGRSSSNPFIILDEYDVSANLDKCCNNSWGRTARTFVWQTSLHGLKYLVYCRKHLLERFGWAIVCLLAASLSLYLAIMAAKHFYEDPTRIHLKKVCNVYYYLVH